MGASSLTLMRSGKIDEKIFLGHNFLPTAGVPFGFVAGQMMVSCGQDHFIEVEYLDEEGGLQKRWLARGIWPLKSTQINGFRGIGAVADPENSVEPIEAKVTSDGIQISVLY